MDDQTNSTPWNSNTSEDSIVINDHAADTSVPSEPSAAHATPASPVATPHKPSAANTDSGFDIQAFEATRAIVTRQAERLEELKRDTKLIAEQLSGLLENDVKLVEEEQQAKQYTQSVKQRKTEIMETQQARQLKTKLGDLKEERSDLEDSISNHLFDLYQTTGVMEFEDITGNVWEYKIKARLGAKKKI